MSVVEHYKYRTSVGLTWREELVVGLLLGQGECKTSYINNLLATPTYTKDVLDNLVRKGFIKKRNFDRRTRMYSITELGVLYLENVEEIYGRRNKR
jgi:DNA-binding MarR family transcriptional regulator